MREISGRPPTSHFHVLAEYDPVLSSLELNFFLTKYYEMKDRDGREVSVYALNYGLCQQQAISFGRPREKREQRLYFVEKSIRLQRHYFLLHQGKPGNCL